MDDLLSFDEDDILSFDDGDDLLSFDDEDDILSFDDGDDLLSFDDEDDLLLLDTEEETYKLVADLKLPKTVEGILKEARMHRKQGRNPARPTGEEVRSDWTAYEEIVYWVDHYKRTKNPFVEEHCLRRTLMIMRHGAYKVPVRCLLKGHENFIVNADVTAATLNGEQVEVMVKLPSDLERYSNTSTCFKYFRFTISYKKSGTYIPPGVPFTLG